MTPSSFSRRRLAIAAAAVAVAASVAGGLALASGSKNGSAAGSGISGVSPITGKRVSLDQFRGKPVVINVWASWCPGCNQEAADLARFASAHPDVGVLGIDTQDTTAGARAFYRKWHWRHPSIADPEGSLAARLGLTGLPTTFFLDARHHVVGKIVGAGTVAAFEQGLRLAQHRA